MNLFITSSCVTDSARALDDRRLNRQILECAQLLSTALRNTPTSVPRDPALINKLYLPTHSHHPVTFWVGASRGNALWTLRFLLACGQEFAFRFPTRRHACLDLIPAMLPLIDDLPPGDDWAPLNWAKSHAEGIDFSHLPTCEAYRAYLNAKWNAEHPHSPPRWTNRMPPAFCIIAQPTLFPEQGATP